MVAVTHLGLEALVTSRGTTEVARQRQLRLPGVGSHSTAWNLILHDALKLQITATNALCRGGFLGGVYNKKQQRTIKLILNSFNFSLTYLT